MKKFTLTLVIIAVVVLIVMGGYLIQQLINETIPDATMVKYILALLATGGVIVYTLIDAFDPMGWYSQLENEEF